ncbi:hypothetical protein PSMK_12770 [Phycisphaera mikurensis NBRC 102666]|uniref:Glycosyltransferase RgtA/B/C/D-like domain-containing protein n=1 Tax=Phycisphaera mikurensis (strain NBRC 102666 / KCTC 22515 / FYK2301M01) TaxID=1142394 RepID=I0IDU8_PHYMF|nr:hypothetical protein PSMK_12770 [Phycisphaera mikurensis NBRC 102666]
MLLLAAGAGGTPSGAAGVGAAVGWLGVLEAVLRSSGLLAGFWLSAWGLGGLLGPRVGTGQRLAVGAAALLLAGWLAAWLLGVSRGVAVGVAAPGWLLLIREARRRPVRRVRVARRPGSLAPLLLAPGLALLLLAACLPPGAVWGVEAFGYDALSYHLQIPREWLAAGRMAFLPHNVYASLPGLMEAAYALAMAALGVDPAAGPLAADRAALAAVPCQLLHAGFAVVAALCIREATDRRGVAGWAAGGAFLALPWVVVTGSSAYNEAAAIALGAAALGLVAADGGPRGPVPPAVRGALIGLLLGAACLAKPTAGFMLALPLGGWMLGRALLDPRNRVGSPCVPGLIARRRRSAALRSVAVATAVGSAVLSPWLLRNALWTGNPVHPFATSTLGLGHWTPELAARWAEAHARPAGAGLGVLWRQWLGNLGFAAVGGTPVAASVTDVARFGREGGFPILWLLAALGAGFAFSRRRTRGLAAGLVGLLAFQLAAWWLLTHHQSRFLVFTALPGAVAVGLLVARPARSCRRGPGVALAGLLAVLAVAVPAAAGFAVLWGQTRAFLDPATGRPVRAAPWELVGALAAPGVEGLDTHPLDALPPGSRVLVVADNGGLFYADTPIVYASAFDENPLAPLMDRAAGDPALLAADLRAAGITHVWIGWSELARLGATYGVDPRLDPAALGRITGGWPGERTPTRALLRVPPATTR